MNKISLDITKVTGTGYLFVVFLFFLNSCATTDPYYKGKNHFKASTAKQKEIAYSIFLIGDTGDPELKKPDKVLNTLEYQLGKAGKNSAILFLGDNIYPDGMTPDSTSKERKRDEAKITRTLQTLKQYKGSSFFIPGNHDWMEGIAGIHAQERFIESYPNADVQFLPNSSCPGPVGLELGNRWFVIVLDSEWWINRSYTSPSHVQACEQQTRTAVINKTAALVEKHDDKRILLTFHHPLQSNGNHGGHYSIKDHIFPLTNLADYLYVPLPLVGSAYPIYRKLGGAEQDLSNEDYEWFKSQILEAVEDHEVNFFASGHEHSLGFYEKDKRKRIKEGKNYFIISGSGSKSSYARAGSGAEFVYSHKGFAKLVSYKDGSLAVEFWIPDEHSKQGKLVYRQILIAPETNEGTKENTARRKKESPGLQDSLITVAAGPDYKAGNFEQFFLGHHYRKAWTTKIDVPVLRLDDGKGGWQILAKTGGMQTVTLITENPEGRKYVMRSVQKNPKKSLPEELQETFVVDIAQDQTSASHPYGRVIIPTLATAAGVYHTTPELKYIPPQAGLNLNVGKQPGTLVTVEEFIDKAWFNRIYDKKAVEVIDTDELWERMRTGKPGVIDQRQLVRSRLFDMYIGDWDRHARQWFWAKTTTDSAAAYQPIPLDRDNAFFKSDGLLLGLAKLWRFRKFQNFGDDIDDIEGINLNAKYFDRWLINELSRQEWLDIARQMQKALTDSVIEATVKQWPSRIRTLNGETFIRKLKERREKLSAFAKRYYDVLSKNVNVFGSDKRELFLVHRNPGGTTSVQMYRMKSDSVQKQLIYHRIFKEEETAEVRLYGFGEADRFEIKGNVEEALKVRIISGAGYDTIYGQSVVSGLSEKTWVYDTKQGSKIVARGEVNNQTSSDPRINRYEKRSFKYDSIRPLIASGFNENDGVFIGGGVLIENHGFRKEPFAARHRITAKIATLTQAFSFDYEGIFTDRIGSFDLELGLDVRGPNYSSNFFGLGNERKKIRDDKDFFVYRYDHVDAKAGVAKNIEKLLTVTAGFGYEYFEPSFTQGRFVTSPAADLAPSAFRRHHYGTLYAGLSVRTTDSKILPEYGVKFNLLSEVKLGLNKRSQTFNRLRSTMSFYYTFPEFTTTLATRVGFATNMGGYKFFQANTLSGKSFSHGSGNLRGFLRDRFSGRTTLYHNTELRTKLIDFESYFFPGSAGVFAFLDEGRVWTDNKSSDLWHFGYGGGIWFSPLQRAVLTVGLALSEEEQLFTVSIGFLF